MRIDIILILSLCIKIVYLQTCSNFDIGIDRSGPWYAHIRTIASPDECCGLCNAEGTRCQSWVYVTIGAAITSGCYLKENIPIVNETSTCGPFCTSGFKEASLVLSGRCAFPGGIYELAVDRPGPRYVRLTSIRSHPACCAMCVLEGEKCRSWTFIRSGVADKESGCLLKSQVPPISTVPCVACTSGTK
ncbi:unnamed protein product [Adineta steineri]|uniref:Apple domain-containing protein n=2 Tax=Adineta steineri TaxID=433720 RepID=A0A818Z9X9_9BILA|nr:unnamed protein product [Adineta steineri]CAF0743960.1 unnamed protein product [Adineta steineri]CAF3765798.1 unnamed protein product [Adineta steineri]CAF3848806.1 unnamed protein product [Adineta steineri]